MSETFAAVIEITWPGVVAVLTAATLALAMARKAWQSNVGRRISEAVFAPVLYELRTNDGGSLKDHIMRRFDDIEAEQAVGKQDREDIRREMTAMRGRFDTEIAHTDPEGEQ